MAKRGERRPWSVRWTWGQTDELPQVSGTKTFQTGEQAAEFRRELEERADRTGRELALTVSNRDAVR